MTNLERIKSLDGYDMSRFLSGFNCARCAYGFSYSGEDIYDCSATKTDCASGIYKWLMQEVEE